MSDSEIEQLERALADIDASMRPGVTAEQCAAARPELGVLIEAFRATNQPSGSHYELHELRELAAARRAATGEWTLPAHLVACPLCLEAFETELEAVPAPAQLLARVEAFGPAERRIFGRASRPLKWGLLAAAASLLVAAGLYYGTRTTGPQVAGKGLVSASGQMVAAGSRLDDNRSLIASSPVELRFSDGSQVSVGKNSRFAVDSRGGGETIDLEQGVVTATVARQRRGKSFVVKTTLGEIVVVGTRFRVSTRLEDVTVFRSSDPSATWQFSESVSAVTATVFEGRVLVKNAHERIVLGPGDTAIMRSGQPGIDVTRGNP